MTRLTDSPPKPRRMLCLDILFGSTTVGQLVIPRDLTQQEADRLCAMIQTLIAPEQT